MSWIFGICTTHANTRPLESFRHAAPLWTALTSNLYLAVGGNPDTCFWEPETDDSPGWAIVGIGITRTDSQPAILARDDWRRILIGESFNATSLDGHFVVLRWKLDRLECFTDQLGLRTLYFGTYDKGICLSTRLDWVAQTTHRAEIDFGALGSRWLLYNQLSYESCVAGIERLGPGGHAVFKDGLTKSLSACTLWLPSFESASPGAARDHLRGIVNCALGYRCKPSLGLSGGLDSRLLLALLTGSGNPDFVTHTFGTPGDPDVLVPRQITEALGIPHRQFDDPLPDMQTCVSGMSSFIAQTLLSEPGSSYLKLRYYPQLREQSRLMIDGGFGEIARRQFLNRVVKLGRSALRKHDAVRLMALMRYHRADVFSTEVTQFLGNGARRSLEASLDEMPAVEGIGVENFADLFIVRTRVPNYGGPGQAWLDGEIVNFMPLIQPSYLHLVFGIPTRLRSNARLYKDIIRTVNPALARFPLVKSGVRYRFGLPSNISWLTVKLTSMIGGGYRDTTTDVLLSHVKEYILDVAHSADVTTNPIYNSRKVLEAVRRYYHGEPGFRSTVDWWLTFELWKRSFQS